MKPIIAALVLLVVPLASSAKEVTVTVGVRGWTCEGCAQKTEKLLRKIDGVVAVKTDDQKRTAQVTYDDAKVKLGDLHKAVVASGFKVAK
jgi:copper chaperone CopZ